MLSLLIMFAMFFVFFWLLFIRPEKKKEASRQQMLNELKIGDTVVTVGGLVGRVKKVLEDEIIIESEGSSVKFKKLSIAVKEEK